MQTLSVFAFDVVAVAALVVVYFRRHRRPDMVAAFVGVNIAVMALAAVLSSTTVGAGFGLGLFGVLAIVRLRSSEIEHVEVAYYFTALTLGLICGLEADPAWLSPLLGALLVAVMTAVDDPRLFLHDRRQGVVLDRAITDESELRGVLENLLGADIQRVLVSAVDLVKDTTVVDVRYRLRPSAAKGRTDLQATTTSADSNGHTERPTSP